MTVAELGDGLLKFYPLLGALCGALGVIGFLWLSRHFTPRADTAALVARVDEVESVVSSISIRLDQLPRSEEIYGLRLAISDVQGNQQALVSQLSGLSTQLGVLQEQTMMITKHLMGEQ